MVNELSSKFKTNKRFYLISSVVLGGAIFALNSTLELNYIIKGYLVLLEAQASLVILYFLFTRGFTKKRRRGNEK